MFYSCAKGSPARDYLEKLRKDFPAGHQKLYIPKMLPEIKKIDPESTINL